MTDSFNIVDLFFQAAEKHPEKVAIVEANQRLTFCELSTQVLDTAGYFQKKGIQKGDRVLIFVPMGMDLYRIVLALFKIGATAVFLDEWVSKKRMEACCQVANCSAFIAVPKIKLLSFLSKDLRSLPIKLGLKYSPKKFSPTQTIKSDTALITFTTGSTGTPKAAKRTHGFLNEQFKALIDKIDPQENDVDMPALPIVLLINLGAGCTSVIADYKASKPELFQPAKVLEQWKKEGVNRFVSSPFLMKEISKHVIQEGITYDGLEKVFTGGAPVFPQEAELYKKAFPNAKIEVVYGSTEAEPISAIGIDELIAEKDNVLEKGLNVGVPYHGTGVKVIRISDEAIACDSEAELNALETTAGEIGEIVVSGSHVLREYYNNDAAIKLNKIFVGETCWHRTGDSGYLDDGKLYLTGRCASLIVKDEEMISPFIYENFFQSIDGIEMGTMIEMDSKVVAVIEKNELFTKKAWDYALVGQDFAFEKIVWVERIPRDPRHNSKIDYGKLRAIVKQ